MNNLPAAAPAAPQTNAQAAKSRNAVQVPANGNVSAVSSETAGFGDDDDDLMFASEFDVDEKFLHMPMQQVPTPPQNMQPSKNTPDAPNGRPNGGVSAGTAQPTGQSPTAAIAKQGNAAAFQPGPGGSRVNNMGAPTPMPGGHNKQPQTIMQSSTNTAIRPQQQTPAPTNNNQPPPPRPVAMPAQPQLGTPQTANMQQRPPQGQSGPPHMANMQQRPPQKINNNQQQNQLQHQQQQQQQQLHQQRMQAANAAHLPQPLVAQRSAPGALAGRPQVPITAVGQQLRPQGQLQGGTPQPMNPGVKRPSEGAEQQVGNAGSPNLIGNRKPANQIRPPDGSNVQGGSGSGGVTNGGGEQATVAGYQYANRVTKRPRAEIPGFS
ncbi:hypothetical protein HDU88_006863 [Geranomyces variabilis]|nr:hypothetical protein HDU88_006863 [Geranomyces variabilis]